MIDNGMTLLISSIRLFKLTRGMIFPYNMSFYTVFNRCKVVYRIQELMYSWHTWSVSLAYKLFLNVPQVISCLSCNDIRYHCVCTFLEHTVYLDKRFWSSPMTFIQDHIARINGTCYDFALWSFHLTPTG